MPRSTADRVFGFRSEGLVRVMMGADPEEVLEAVETLGLIPAEHEHDPPPTLQPTNSSAKIAEAQGLLGELTSLLEAMDTIEGRIHRFARTLDANRTRNQALSDVVALDGLNAIFGDLKGQYEGFSAILAFILNVFFQNAVAIEEKAEEETTTTTTI